MSLAFWGHNEQLGLGCVRGQRMFLLWLTIYYGYWNFNVCVIWELVSPVAFQK